MRMSTVKNKGAVILAIVIILILAMSLLFLYASATGSTADASIEIGPSEKYSENEIMQAILCMKVHLKMDFSDWNLTKIKYNENFSNKQVGQNNLNEIVIFANYTYVVKGTNETKTVENWSFKFYRPTTLSGWIYRDSGKG